MKKRGLPQDLLLEGWEWSKQLGRQLAEWPTLLRAWRDVFCPWRWPKYDQYSQVSMRPGWVVGWGALFLLAWIAMLVRQIMVAKIGFLTPFFASVQIVMFLYCFTFPIRMRQSFLRVTTEVVPFLDSYSLYDHELAMEALRGSSPDAFVKHFWWLMEENQDRAYRALRETTGRNRSELSEEEIQKLLQSQHPGLRQEAIRIIGNQDG